MPDQTPDPLAPQPEERPLRTYVIGAVAGTIVFGVLGWGTWNLVSTFTTDDVDVIDSSEVRDAVEAPCADMAAASDDLDSIDGRTAFVEAARAIPAAIDALDSGTLDSDRPAREWSQDWTDLLEALDTSGPFTTPVTDDGYSVETRMDKAAPKGCQVPASVWSLDTDPPEKP